ncbi:MAG: O-antigen ligase family protein [Gammaproteobacteria bacterium]
MELANPRLIDSGHALYRIRVGAIWRFLTRQPASYWLICMYLFFEYVRPQQIYTAIAFFPWAWLSIVLCVASFVIEGARVRRWNPIDGLLGLFAIIVLASTALAYAPEVSFRELPVFLSWIVIYFLITNTVTTERRFLVFVLSFLLYNFKMSLHSTRSWASIGFAFRDWGTTGAPGWFHNSGEFGIEMTIFFPLAVFFITALRPYWSRAKRAVFWLLPATALTGMVASSSRGALLGGGMVLVWMLARSKSRYKLRALAVAGLLVAVIIVIIPPEQMERLRMIGTDQSSQVRLRRWREGVDMANAHPAFGVGYANWVEYSVDHYAITATLDPHNVLIQAVAELGYTGLLAFALLIAYTFVVNRRTRRLARALEGGGLFLSNMATGLDGALVGFLVSGFFVTVLYYPFFWINLAMTVALHTATRNELARAAVAGAAGPQLAAEGGRS